MYSSSLNLNSSKDMLVEKLKSDLLEILDEQDIVKNNIKIIKYFILALHYN